MNYRHNVLVQAAASADPSRMAQSVVEYMAKKIAKIEAERGIKIDWMVHLSEKEGYTARDVINAMGQALEVAKISNNLRDLAGEI